MIRKFVVQAEVEIEVEFNDELLPDDEWRTQFYEIYTLEDLAEHLAWNLGFNRGRLSMLDGFADRPDSDAKASLDVEWGDVQEIGK